MALTRRGLCRKQSSNPANYEISEFSATLLLEPGIISNHHTNDIFLFFPLHHCTPLLFSGAVNFSLLSSEFRSEPIGWIGCNDRLTNCEWRNTKGSVSLHQPRMTSSLSRRVNSHHGDNNHQIRLFLSLSHLISHLLKKKKVFPPHECILTAGGLPRHPSV